VLPLLFLFWEAGRQEMGEAEAESNRLLDRSNPLTRLFRELSAPDAPIRSRARRLKNAWENMDVATLPIDLRQNRIERALQFLSSTRASETFLWAVVFPDGNPELKPQVLSGKRIAVS